MKLLIITVGVLTSLNCFANVSLEDFQKKCPDYTTEEANEAVKTLNTPVPSSLLEAINNNTSIADAVEKLTQSEKEILEKEVPACWVK